MRIAIERIQQRWSARLSVCEIYGEPETRMNKISRFRLDDDHDHQTGKFRGRLCAACNTGLGLFRDDPMLLRMAAPSR